jgi:translation initiation factor IF-2
VPARIYALAKELNLDSKDLVDLVKKVGITGKGSALASLTDDETQRVRDYLGGASEPSKPAPVTTAPAAVRDAVARERKPVAIKVGRSSAPAERRVPKSAPAAPVEPPSTPPLAQPASAQPASAKPASAKPAPAQPASAPPPAERPAEEAVPVAKKAGMADGIRSRMAMRSKHSEASAPIRSDSLSGGASGGKVRSLDRPSSGGAEKGAVEPKGKRREPRINVNLASLPDSPQPGPVKAGSGEPKAQKPDVRLSKDVIQGHKQGMKAPLEQLAQEDTDKKRGVKRVAGGLSGFTGDKPKRGKTGPEEEEKPRKKPGIAGMASARAERSRGGKRRNISLDQSSYGGRHGSRHRGMQRRKGVNTAAPRKDTIVLELPCTIRSFSEAAGVPVAQVLRVLMGMQMMVNINSQLDLETAEVIANELDLTIELKAAETLEDSLITGLEEREDDPDSLVPRAPIVTFLGHVDHGKTSLLDYLIGIDVVSGEAGGITQHIRAYEVEKDGRSITFVDTPGHEAFTEMRARGANVTDIAVLVVAADDGIMPQTEEAISHAKAAEVPIVVALNKIDLEGVDTNRVMTQLTEYQLTPSEWGGDVEVVGTSAITGTGMDELLETLLTVAELNEYSANPGREALGVCLEAEQQGDRGVVAKLIVQNGTLKLGDIVVCGAAHGRVRAMSETLSGKAIEVAGPSIPVNVMGFDQAPDAGDRFHVLGDIGQAREIAARRAHAASQESLSGVSTKVSFENFQEMLQQGLIGQQAEKVKLNLIIRADVKGSLEAIDKELSKFDNPEVELRVLQRSVGGVTLADVTLASASDAVVIAFNVIPDEQARSLADERNVQIRRYEVIYKLTDDIKAMIEGRLKPEERVIELGRALVKQVFSISRVGTIAGCYVAQGSIQRGCRIRVNRDGRTIGDYALDSLKRIKEDVKEVPRGMECGIRLQGFNDIKQDDVLEAYRIEEFARTLD